jgi:ADP-ribosylglycohydrolase
MTSASTQHSTLYGKVYGCLVGGLIGDAMGSPAEGKTYSEIKEQFGEITGFQGVGTDDTAIRQQLCDAIIQANGDVTADEFAASFLKFKAEYYKLWWIPVKNMFHKIESHLALPVDAGYGNMHSSSSAMAISPMGIINACQPRLAAMETFDVAGLIHSGPSGFCRDAACGMAAAVAEAFKPSATVESIITASTAYLHPVSSAVMIGARWRTSSPTPARRSP